MSDENIFLLENSKIISNTQNFDQSKLSATHDNKAIDVNNTTLIKIIENQLMIILAIITSVIKPLIMNYLIKLQMIKAKIVAGLIRINRITIILTIQEQFNMMLLPEMIKIIKMCKIHQVRNVYIYLETA